jgi:hypothetical protein
LKCYLPGLFVGALGQGLATTLLGGVITVARGLGELLRGQLGMIFRIIKIITGVLVAVELILHQASGGDAAKLLVGGVLVGADVSEDGRLSELEVAVEWEHGRVVVERHAFEIVVDHAQVLGHLGRAGGADAQDVVDGGEKALLDVGLGRAVPGKHIFSAIY